MFTGRLIGIFVTPKKRAALDSVQQIEAEAGRGLVGDRYYLREGTFTKDRDPDREVTLIEKEAIAALGQEDGLDLEPGRARRNLLTEGVPLNHLVGKEFSVGEVLLRGIRLCEPCKHLEGLTVEGVMKGLCHRGGLRAQILRGGTLRVGDGIQEMTRE